jgi:Flp pilus assembly protein TadB
MVTPMAALIRIVAIVACAIVAIGFFAFANDEATQGSSKQVQRIQQAMDDPSPSANEEQLRQRRHGKVRETIDDANDVLLKPFSGIVDSKDAWVIRIVPTVLALLVYGLGLTLLANMIPRRKPRSTGDWRTAT